MECMYCTDSLNRKVLLEKPCRWSPFLFDSRVEGEWALKYLPYHHLINHPREHTLNLNPFSSEVRAGDTSRLTYLGLLN